MSKESEKLNRKIKIFIQINIGNEDQKTGIKKEELENFYTFCKNLNLDVQGLMCIPPLNENAKSYFKEMFELSDGIRDDGSTLIHVRHVKVRTIQRILRDV